MIRGSKATIRSRQGAGQSRFAGQDGFSGKARGAIAGGSRFYRLGGACCLATLASCGSFNMFSTDQDVAMGLQAYDQILEGERLIQSGSEYQMVNEVTDRLIGATFQVSPELAEKFDWQVSLIDNAETVNAFALPGGKMAVYTGILPVAQGPTGLAVVMGHEIAHATERHGTQAVSRSQLAGFGMSIASALLGDSKTPAYAAALAQGATALVQLSYGRGAELEADRVGLRIMATAGYDPREAVNFWERMAALSGGSAPIEFLSTHPSNESRIQQIRDLLPEVIPIYEAARQSPPPKAPDPVAPGPSAPGEGDAKQPKNRWN